MGKGNLALYPQHTVQLTAYAAACICSSTGLSSTMQGLVVRVVGLRSLVVEKFVRWGTGHFLLCMTIGDLCTIRRRYIQVNNGIYRNYNNNLVKRHEAIETLILRLNWI